MANYADDNSPYESSFNIAEVILQLEEDANILVDWFANNYLKPNPEKWHLLLNSISEVHCIKIGQQLIVNSKTEKVCKKASQKLYVLARISNFMSCNQRKITMNAFISSQFNYCPLVWMCHNRSPNTQINNIHHIALSIVYRDHTSSFETLLEKSGLISIHHRNIQLRSTEIFKTLNNLSPSIMSEIFKLKKTTYALRTGSYFSSNYHIWT